MPSKFKLIPGWDQYTKKLGRVQILRTDETGELDCSNPELKIFPRWDQLRQSNVFWRKRGWYLCKSSEGSLYYQCIPTNSDRLRTLLELLSHDELITQMRKASNNRLFQILMIDQLMHCDEEHEESFMSSLWDAVEGAMIAGLLLAEELRILRKP